MVARSQPAGYLASDKWVGHELVEMYLLCSFADGDGDTANQLAKPAWRHPSWWVQRAACLLSLQHCRLTHMLMLPFLGAKLPDNSANRVSVSLTLPL